MSGVNRSPVNNIVRERNHSTAIYSIKKLCTHGKYPRSW